MASGLDPAALQAMFGAGTPDADGNLSWKLEGGDAAKALGIDIPAPSMPAAPELPQVPPVQRTESFGPPVVLPQKSSWAPTALLAALLLVEVLRLLLELAPYLPRR